ncbi:MAG: alpha-1,2-fucosyltransferase [Verrucomicrobia bacterium]|nr:alpha-1,2-fucosyltransferase [Verrucomicrobiota bacterium]
MIKVSILFLKVFSSISFLLPISSIATNYATICDKDGSFSIRNQFAVQLLDICSVLAFAWDNQLVPYFPTEFLLSTKGASINYPYVFFRLNQELPEDIEKSPPIHIRERCPYAPLGRNEMNNLQYAPYAGNNVCMCLAGIYPYYHYRDKLREYFAPTQDLERYLKQKYQQIIDHPKTVALHIRTYHPEITLQFFLGREYYLNAMNQFPDDYLFVVFSDRIAWAKQELSGAKPNMVFIEEGNHIFEFYLMTYCQNHIISNSHFSFMAAFLKVNPSGQTLVPEVWHSNAKPSDYEGLFFPGCMALPVTRCSPNWDLLNYQSTSMDEGGPQY